MMRDYLYILLLLIISESLIAKIYSQSDIQHFYLNEDKALQRSIANEYLNSDNPVALINEKINKHKDPLQFEFILFNLLNDIEYQKVTSKHKSIIKYLKQYQSQALKYHEEGSLQIPVFNIQARATGIENYWTYNNIKQNIVNDFSTNFISAIKTIKVILSEQHEAKILGLKDSIDLFPNETTLQLSNYFLNNPNSIKGIEKFVIDFALKNKDKRLTYNLNTNLDKVNSEYLLTKLTENFEIDFSLQLIIDHTKQGHADRFAMTLLKPYANSNKEVQAYLIGALDNISLASTAAFSLSNLTDQLAINSLYQKYSTSVSKTEKQYILFALKLNKNEISQNLFNRLTEGK